MLLKKSWVDRRSVHGGTVRQVDAGQVTPPTGYKDESVEFRFDMGTENRREQLSFFLHNADFEAVARFMAEAHREKAIQAFSKALIKTRPTS